MSFGCVPLDACLWTCAFGYVPLGMCHLDMYPLVSVFRFVSFGLCLLGCVFGAVSLIMRLCLESVP